MPIVLMTVLCACTNDNTLPSGSPALTDDFLVDAPEFATLHGTGGQEFYVNPEQITSLREPVGSDLRHFPRGTHCVIVMVNGKFVPIVEHCIEARRIIEQKP